MSTSNTESTDKEYEKQLSVIIQGESIDLCIGSRYKSIMQIRAKINGRKEKEIMIYLQNW